jgi:hypothetical protein
MVDLRIEINQQQLAAFRSRIDEKRIARAARRAGNDGMEEAQRAAVAYVRTKKRIKESTIERRLSVVLPSNRAGLAAMRWGLKVSPRPISLGSYPSTQTPLGVTAEVNVGQTFLLRHAFIQTVRGGFRGVFERQGPGAPRDPIKSLVGSGVGDVLRDAAAGEAIQQAFQSATAAALSRYLEQEATQGGGG